MTVQIPEVKHKVRIVVLWHYRKDEACCKILVTNRITWEVRGYPAILFFNSNGLRLINERRSQRLRSCLKGACSKPTNKFVATSAYITTNSLPDSLSEIQAVADRLLSQAA